MKNKNEKSFDIAHQNRMFEVELFWKRALFFWGFIASTFFGYINVNEKSHGVAIVVSSFGLVCSFAWALANRGSKYWQEYWERKVEELEEKIVGELFVDYEPYKSKNFWLGSRKYSVSKLSIVISDYLIFIWICIISYEVYQSLLIHQLNLFIVVFLFVTLLYMLFIFKLTKSKVEIKQIRN